MDGYFSTFASVWEVHFQACPSANFKEKMHIYFHVCFFFVWGCVWGFLGVFWLVFLGFVFLFSPSCFPVPSYICTFVWKQSLSAVLGLGVELIQQNFSAIVVSLTVPFVPTGCKCDYIGNKLLKHFLHSLCLASTRTDCPCS